MKSAPRVVVETVLLGAGATGLTYRIRSDDLRDGDRPDALAWALAGLCEADRPDAVLHSTSWRFAPGEVILTYVALPDPSPARGQPLARGDDLARGREPTAPAPIGIPRGAVIAHACRHLAFLRRTDALIARQANNQPGLWCLIDAFEPGVAGGMAGEG
jgi:hypothetical protein